MKSAHILALTAAVQLLPVAGIADEYGAPGDGIVACAKIDDDGIVTGAFVVVSTGNTQQDASLLTGIQNLNWGKKRSHEVRNVWFPIGLAIDGKKPPPGPASCAPPSS